MPSLTTRARGAAASAASRFASYVSPRPQRRAATIADVVGWMGLGGLGGLLQTTMSHEAESPDGSYESLVYTAYMRNSVMHSCLMLRARLYSEPRFAFQQIRNGRAGNLFGTPALAPLERPSADLGTRGMLAQVRLQADIGGHGFALLEGGEIDVLRPDWTVMAYGSRARGSELGWWDPKARITGFGYYPGGTASGEPPMVYLPGQVAHVVGDYNPLARFRGGSLVMAALREVLADNAATTHKLSFFEHAATPNLTLKFPATMSQEAAEEWVELFEQDHHGALNAWRTLYLGGGVDVVPVGLNFQEMDFTKLQGEAETRIAALTGMHPVVAALSEGLAGSSLNAGNFAQAARLVGDAHLRPLWGEMAAAFEAIVPAPPGSRLWYEERDVAFLRSDVTDQADITQKNAAAIGQLVKDGFTAASAVDAVTTGDMTRLVQDEEWRSVQLQRADQSSAADAAAPDATPADHPAPAAFRSTVDFWAVGSSLDGRGHVARGAVLRPSDPIVSAYRSLFEPVAAAARLPERAKSGPEQIATVQDVRDAREHLKGLGKPYGAGSIAKYLHVSEDTVRRRQAEERAEEQAAAERLAEASAPRVTVQAPPAPQVTVEAPRVEVHTPPVNVTTPPVSVTVERGAVEVQAPVTVTTPDIHVGDVHEVLDAGQIADVVAERLDELQSRPVVKDVERDAAGLIVKITETRAARED